MDFPAPLVTEARKNELMDVLVWQLAPGVEHNRRLGFMIWASIAFIAGSLFFPELVVYRSGMLEARLGSRNC